MKKIIASALGLMVAGGVAATTASAVESQFGGYWRTRAFYQDNFTQGSDYWRMDNRTRLYYTAKFNDDFKFVNKFEFNSVWGDDNGGDIGADGDTFRVKNSYADFNLGTTNVKLGIQGATIARGFLFDDDFSGIMVTGNFGNVSVTPFYIAVQTEDGGGADFDRGYFGAVASVKISDAISMSPYFVYDAASSGTTDTTEDVVVAIGEPLETVVTSSTAAGDMDNFFVGTDIDVKMDAVSLWGTFIYNGYTIQDVDGDAFLVAGGANAGIAHGQAFYATGDDAFMNPRGRSYYWSEILGLGVFDNTAPTGSPADGITNIAAFNAGVTVKPMDKLTFDADVWYAMLAEDNAMGEDELGLEFDGKLTYALMDNLNAEFILAYLVAGDAVGDDDVFEGGVRVSLKF
ncbi:hypothetical protein [Desulforhopalus sp. IMCC35007]|uniref:hypothetical protein n=1 Tax=Desulforhopalus sp. IMCC35007 TaxID=2569543 RepID=UPI0010AE2D0D|nr:hypothetical protein [Desulforhopalus sp. IMCC35007]TKB06335.1 hypothetical protein FCL48_21510 [Desulforhopalus sp. IMCC35007]